MKNSEKYIGVFDSGIGGLTLVKALLEKMPNENIVYFADSKHMPYGDKTNEQIIKYVAGDVDFLNNYDLKTIVIACNTADSVASKTIKQNYDIPVYGVVSATAQVAANTTQNNKIGVIATTATIKTDEYSKQIAGFNCRAQVFNQACPFLTPLIEEGEFDIGNQKIRYILEDYLAPLIEKEIDTLILGCTHYDLLLPIIKDMYPNLNIVSSSRCVVDIIANEIDKNEDSHSEQLYFTSSDKNKFKEIASMFMHNIEVQEI